MARPKDHVYANASAAFVEKCEKEHSRLQQRLTQQLRFDLHSLQEDNSQSDLQLVVPNDILHLHSAILRARCPKFYCDFLDSPQPGSSKNLDFANVSQLKDVIKAIYTSDDLSAVELLIEKWINRRKRSSSNSGEIAPSGLNGKSDDPNANIHDRTRAENIFSPDVDIVLNDFYDPRQTSSGLMTPFDPNLDFEAGLKGSSRTNTSGENKENEDTDTQTRGCCKLADDLLSMFERSLYSDVTIVSGDKEFKAHRCILCVRSTYFAAMLSGSWMESESQVIRLEGISPGVVEQLLLGIYGSGNMNLQTSRITELVAAADMYAITSVKDMACYELKMDYCHFFHKPCTGCVATVPEAMPLAYTYGLIDILERCYKWNARHFVRLWPTKNFAILPNEIMTECCKAVVDELTCDNVISVALDYDRLKGSLPHGRVRWAEPITNLAKKLIDACVDFLKNRIVEVISTDKFKEFGTTNALGLNLLEDVFTRAIHDMPPEKAPGTYRRLVELDEWAKSEPDPNKYNPNDCSWTEEFKTMMSNLKDKCQQYMNLHIQKLVITASWKELPVETQKKLKEGAFYVDVRHIKKKEPAKRRDHKTAMYGRVQKPKPHGKGAASGGGKAGVTSPSPKSDQKPKDGDTAEGATVLPAESEEGAVGGAAVDDAASTNSQTTPNSQESCDTKQKFRKPTPGSGDSAIPKSTMGVNATRRSPQVSTAKSVSQKKSSHKGSEPRTSLPFKFQSQLSSPKKASSSKQNSGTRKSHAVSHKDEPKEKKAKISAEEKEQRKMSRLPVAQQAKIGVKKSAIPKSCAKQGSRNSESASSDQRPMSDDQINGTSRQGTANRVMAGGVKEADLRKKLMLHRNDSDHKLVDDDAVSLCSNMAVRGSVCNSNDDLSPSDFGSDCFSETSSQHDLDNQICPALRLQDQQAVAGDDGYSSNRTNPDDYSPQIEQLLAAVDAVHFEPEPLLSTFDVVFEPPNQDNEQEH